MEINIIIVELSIAMQINAMCLNNKCYVSPCVEGSVSVMLSLLQRRAAILNSSSLFSLFYIREL